MGILVNEHCYHRHYVSFGKIYKFSPDESNEYLIITWLGFAVEPSPDHAGRQPVSSNSHKCD
jgi:hypothetical protein